jgi:tetratricopeptide (TPR) repeat protein
VLVERLKEMKDVDTPEHLMAGMDRALKSADESRYREKELRAAADNDPENPVVWKALGDFYEEHNQYKAAIEALGQARELALDHDDHRIVEPITFDMTYMSLSLRDYDAAAEESAYYMQSFPGSERLDQVYLYRGYALFYGKKHDEATKVLKEQIAKFPKSPFNANAEEILSAIAKESR